MKLYRAFLKIIILAILLGLLLTACGGDETPLPTAEPTTTTSALANTKTSLTPASVVTATATAVGPTSVPRLVSTAGIPPSPTAIRAITGDQTLTMPLGGDVNSFDPALGSDVTTGFALRQLYSGLITLDKDLQPVPDLALSMPEVSENNTLYTFKLRQGAKFQSGREITADDFKFSLERATDPKLAAPDTASSLPAATYMNDIVGVKEKLDGKTDKLDGVRVKDKYTLQIKLDGPKPQFLAKMAFNVFFVVNKDAVAKGFDDVDGSGPFKLFNYRRNQYLKLVRNDNYYLGPPRLANLNFVMGANAANSSVLYDQNKLDVVGLSASAETERALDKNNPLHAELVVKPELEVNYLAFNTRVRPFDDPKVRQAFSIVVDRPRIARAMYESKVQPAISLLPPGLPGYSGKTGPLNYDISRARDLIAQSSYRNAANFPRITLYSTGDPLGRVLQETYNQAFGIDLEVRQYDFKDFQSGLSQRQFQMYLYGWTADYPDPENFLRSLLGSTSTYNDTGYNNAQFDDLMKQGDQQIDPNRRYELYQQAEQLALGDAPLLPIYHNISYTLVKPYVKGLEITQAGIWTLKDVYILK